jgi:thiaminase/transcriptional activator TenA
MVIMDNTSPPLTELLWSDIEDIYSKVVTHPFITGLGDGTLPPESFQHYIVQDAHYLRGYARVLAVCAAKAEHTADTVMFARHAGDAVAAEQDLHASLLIEMGSSPQAAALEPVGPTTHAYVSYLLATAYGGSFAEALGAVLPCYWLYAKVSEKLRDQGCPVPLYARWIGAYGGTAFQSVVDEVLATTDRVGSELSERERSLVRAHVMAAARYEWMFWDAGYRCERWPV